MIYTNDRRHPGGFYKFKDLKPKEDDLVYIILKDGKAKDPLYRYDEEHGYFKPIMKELLADPKNWVEERLVLAWQDLKFE